MMPLVFNHQRWKWDGYRKLVSSVAQQVMCMRWSTWTVHEVCEVSESQEQSAKYAPFPLCRDPYSESSVNIRIMFERTKVFSKKSSLRDKIHQNPPSLRDFSVFNHAMRNFYCTFAPVLGKATNKTEE